MRTLQSHEQSYRALVRSEARAKVYLSSWLKCDLEISAGNACFGVIKVCSDMPCFAVVSGLPAMACLSLSDGQGLIGGSLESRSLSLWVVWLKLFKFMHAVFFEKAENMTYATYFDSKLASKVPLCVP